MNGCDQFSCVFDFFVVVFLYFISFFPFFPFFMNLGQCSGDDDGRRAGICHPADDNGQAAVWPSRQNDRSTRNLVLRSSVYRQQELFHLAQIEQKGILFEMDFVPFDLFRLGTRIVRKKNNWHFLSFFPPHFSLTVFLNNKPNDYVKDVFRFILGRGYCQDQVHYTAKSLETVEFHR